MFKKGLSVLITLSLLLLSTSIGSLSATASVEEKKYSGEELLKGIIFGIGDATKELTNVWTNEEYELNNDKTVVKHVDILVDEIEKIDPTYLERLEKNIYSEDYVKVEKNFTEFEKLLDKANKNLNNSNESSTLESETIDPMVGTVISFVQDLATTNLNVRISVVTKVGTGIYGFSNTETTQLVKEDFVDKVISSYN